MIPIDHMFSAKKITKLAVLTGKSYYRFFSSDVIRSMDGQLMKPEVNPGLNVMKQFVTTTEEVLILRELDELKSISFRSQDTLYLKSTGSQKSETSNIAVDSYRVTGRPEVLHQTKAPWGYGDHFELHNVPAAIRNIATKIQSSTQFNVKTSKLRDITVNYRTKSMFRLDPHVDPAEDGDNVFVIGFKSDVVFTFTPDISSASYLASSAAQRGFKPLVVRTDEQAIALRSWTDDDLDVLLEQRDLLHFTGDARQLWKHAIRSGLDVGPPFDCICDWWGDLNNLSRRSPDRVSIVFAFQ